MENKLTVPNWITAKWKTFTPIEEVMNRIRAEFRKLAELGFIRQEIA